VSIGRGAFYNPWIFRHTQEYLATGRAPPAPGYAELVRVMRRHLDLMVETFGENLGCQLFRKPASWYARRFGPAKPFKQAVVALRTRAEFDEVLAAYERWRAQFCDERGDLLPKFRPGPLVASFLRPDADDPAALRRDAIPVPKGPVDVW
jgi:hypothetical protein